MNNEDRISLRDYVDAMLRERDKAIAANLESVRNASRHTYEWATLLISIGALVISLATAIIVFFHH